MRYRGLLDARAWKKYEGRDHRCFIVGTSNLNEPNRELVEVSVQLGNVTTGKQRVWAGYFMHVEGPDEKTWLAEHPHFLRGALREVEKLLNADGWSLLAIGLTPEWHETGLSANSGFGYHPDFDHAVHMLQPERRDRPEGFVPR